MSVELIKDSFKFEQVVGEDIAQTVVEGDILVPDTKPDITRVLSADARIELSEQKIEENKIAVRGITYFKILYVSEKEEQPLYSIDSSAEFKQDIDIEGINAEMQAQVIAEVEHVDFVVNNERKVGVKAVINLHGKGIEERTAEIAQDVEGPEDIQVLKETFQYTDIVGVSKTETLIKDGFELGEDEYEIREILKWDAAVSEKGIKIADGKIIVDGMVNLELLYIDEEYDNQLKTIKREIPFTHIVDITGVLSDMNYKLKFSINELYHDIKENIRGEKKIVELEGIIKVESKVIDTQSREILADTYSLSKELGISREQIGLEKNVGINKVNALVNETLDMPSEHLPISGVFSVGVKPFLTDYNVAADNVTAEGILEVTVLYKTAEESQALYSLTEEIPFRHYIEFENSDLKEGAEAEIDLFIEEVDYSVVDGEQVEVKVNMGILCEVFHTEFLDIISGVEEAEEEIDLKSRPSLTIYYIQPGDTPWEIAKKYHTTVQRIMETNEIEEPTDIEDCDHIIIEKVHNFKF